MNTSSSTSITLIGCGKMGQAMLSAWQSSDLNANYTIIDRNHANADFNNIADAEHAINNADIVVMGVKPQGMAEACTAAAPYVSKNALILSIAFGKSISSFENIFSTEQPIIRTMPNTPSAIGKGITIGVANTHVTQAHKELTNALLSLNGVFKWIEDEDQMNAVSALSGSGPAYVFLLIETLTKAGESIGLPKSLAETLARQTIIGSAALAETSPQQAAETLRKNVTSPGGGTEAALEILMNGELDLLFKNALKANAKRGIELNKD